MKSDLKVHKTLPYMLDPSEYEKFFREALKVIHIRTGEIAPFNINESQREFINSLTYNNLVLKSRRLGFSTSILGMAFLNCLAFKNYRASFVADNTANSLAIFDKIHLFLKNLPFKCETTIESKGEIVFADTGSKITVSTAGTKTAGRGRDLHFIHLSECAFYEDPSIVTALREARLKNGMSFLETTAHGTNWYFDLWEQSQGYPKTSEFRPVFVGWNKHTECTRPVTPEFALSMDEKAVVEEAKANGVELSLEQMCWRRYKLNEMTDPTLFVQEYPLFPHEAFISSGHPVFNVGQLSRMKNCSADYRAGSLDISKSGNLHFFEERQGNLKIFGQGFPKSNERFVIGADTAEGREGGDYNVASVWRITDKVQVAELHVLCDPDTFAYYLNQLGRFYNTAVMGPERNNTGHAVISMLYNVYNYPRLWQEDIEDATMLSNPTENVGFRTNKATKVSLIAIGKRAIRLGEVKLNSVPAILEFMSFITTKTGGFEAERGKHDDRVIAALIAWYILEKGNYITSTYYKDDVSKYRTNEQRTHKKLNRTGY